MISYYYYVQIVNEGTKYVGHFLRVPYKNYPSAFENALEVASGDIEVDEMRQVPASLVSSSIGTTNFPLGCFRIHAGGFPLLV